MSDNFSIIKSDNYKKESLSLLNQYAKCILACLGTDKEPFLLNGAAVAVRKSIEFMAAYFVFHHPRNDKQRIYKRSGENLINAHENSNGKKASDFSASRLVIDGVDSGILEDFIGNTENAESIKGLDIRLSRSLHYQHRGSIPNKEKEALLHEGENILECILIYKRLLYSFLLFEGLNLSNPDSKGYSHLTQLVSISDKVLDNTKAIIRHKIGDLSQYFPWNDYYSQIINICASVTREGTENPMIYIDTLYSSVRKLAERTGYVIIEKDAPDIFEKLKNESSVTLESFTQIKPSDITNGNLVEWGNIKKYISKVQHLTNSQMHWNDASISASLITSESALARDFISGTGYVDDAITWGSLLMDQITMQNTNQPVSVRVLVNTRSEKIIKMQQDLTAAEKRFKIVTGAFVCSMVIIVAILCYHAIDGYLHNARKNDPNPQYDEAFIAQSSWNEIPEIHVFSGEQELNADDFSVIYFSDSAKIRLQASCNGEYSKQYANDKRFAELNDFYCNPYGLARLGYELRNLNKDDPLRRTIHSVYCADGYSDIKIDEPGWYHLRVQAVGAADGFTKKGGLELNAATGWRSYNLLVLDAQDHGNWSLLNTSTNTFAKPKDGLYIQEGDSLLADCDIEFQEGLTLSYSWDNGEWKNTQDNLVVVPVMNAGLHILNLRASYVQNELIFSSEAYTESFNCMFNVPTIHEQSVHLTVKTSDGIAIQDGNTLIVKPEDELEVLAYEKDRIARLEWYVVYPDGTQSDVQSHESSFMTLTLNGDYGKKRSLLIRAVGVDNLGREDPENYKEMSINLLTITKENECDEDGNILKRWLYENPSSNEPTGYILIYKYDDQGRSLDWAYFTADDQPAYSSKYGCHRITMEYTEDGWNGWAFDLDGNSLIEGSNAFGEEANGAAGKSYRKVESESGSEVWVSYYGADAKPYKGLRETASYYQIQDTEGNCLQEYIFDGYGNPDENSYGWHHLEQEWTNGYCTKIEYFDINNDPCNHALYNCHKEEYTYDEYGNCTSSICYTADGKPVIVHGSAKDISLYLPGTEYETMCEYQDEYGNPVMNTFYGYSRVEREYEKDKDGNYILTKEVYFDANNTYINSADGYARYEYKREGLHAVTSYYDAGGNLVCPENQDWAKCEEDFNNNGLLREVRYYKNDTDLVGEGSWGSEVAKTTYSYDNDDRKTGEFYWNAQGQPVCAVNTNYCGLSYIPDATNKSAYYVYYLDEEGNPIYNNHDFYYSKKTEDQYGRVVIEERFLEGGIPPTGDTIRRIEWAFDGGSNDVISISEFTEQRIGIISQTVRTYDENEQLTSEFYYDGEGLPIEDNYGVWKYTYSGTSDSKLRIRTRREECLDASGALTIGPDGFAAVERWYSWDPAPDYCFFSGGDYDIGNYSYVGEEVLAIRFYGNNGKEMVHPEEGYAVYKREISADQTAEAYYDASGNLLFMENEGYAKLVRKYKNGNLVEWDYYGSDGQPCLNHYGFAAEKWEYDEEDRLISHSFHNADENMSLMLNEYGTYAMEQWIYEDNREYHGFYGEDGKLRMNSDAGYAAVVHEWDGNTFKTFYLDADGNKMIVDLQGYGYAERIASQIEQNGNTGIEIRFLDKKGNLMVSPSYGFARVIQLEDEQGRVIEQQFYDANASVYVDSFNVFSRSPADSGSAIINAARIKWIYDDNDEENALYCESWRPIDSEVWENSTMRADQIVCNYAEGIAKFEMDGSHWYSPFYWWYAISADEHIVAIERYDTHGNLME